MVTFIKQEVIKITVNTNDKKKEELHFRHELKYDIGMSEYYQLIPRIRAVMKRDGNVGKDGTYRIQSVYFDNYRDKALKEKTVGIQKREKFRIRWYNDNTEFIKLEKKMKINNLPDYAIDCMFIVVRECENGLWFWGAYDDNETANHAAKEINGSVIWNVKE